MAASGMRPSPARRTAWVIGDQALSGVTNVAATIAVARSVSSQAFGAFSVGFIVYILALGVVRGLVSQPLAVRRSASGVSRDQMAGAAGAALVTGAAIGLPLAGIGIVIGGDVGLVIAVVGAFLPFLLLQDTWRFVFITTGRPGRAAAIDGAWAIAQVLFMGAVLLADGGLVALVVAWTASGAVAGGVGVVMERTLPSAHGAVDALRTHADLGPWFAAEFVFDTGSSQVTTLLLGGTIGAVGIGAIKGGQTLFGPYYLAMTGMMSAAVPEGVRLVARAPGRLVPVLRSMSGVLALIAVAWAAAVAAMPDACWGRALLGDTWDGAERLVIPLGAAAAGHAIASGGVIGLRVAAAARESLALRVAVGVVTLVAGIAGGVAAGVQGAMWGLAVGSWATAAAAWWTFLRVTHRAPRDQRAERRCDRHDAFGTGGIPLTATTDFVSPIHLSR